MTKRVMAALLAAVVLIGPTPVAAQAQLEGRVGRLESEMRAVQRKVFPGGAAATVEPQITGPAPTLEVPGTPAGGALADLTARVAALESSVQSVTGQVEQAGYRVRQLETAFEAYKVATEARLKAVEGTTALSAATGNDASAAGPEPVQPTARPVTRPASPRPALANATAADPDRAEQVAAVPRPDTGDPAEDGYTYGYRLWQAKLYPEAQKELEAVATKYPKHRRASFAQNLLGRSYLDDGKPSRASIAFYDSYKKFPEGERAPDSLLYLGQALTQLKKPADACKVYDELTDVYAAKLSAGMKADVAKGRAAAKCS
jgi:TolA-binding protein